LEGPQKTYFRNGKLHKVQLFKNYNLEGLSKTFHPNGVLASEIA
jgi:antitoxin component YwqK of YwqJK toxin-antitoxin module